MAKIQEPYISRAAHLHYVLSSALLSGRAPSPYLVSLLSQYHAGMLSASQLTESLKEHYQRPE